MASENVKRVSLYLPEKDYELLRGVAFIRHITMNEVVRESIEICCQSGNPVMVKG
jgi:hypothetical protein